MKGGYAGAMSPQTVTLPRLVGARAVVNAALVPHREEARLGVSFRDVRQVSDSALHEIVLTGTNHGTRPLHLLDIGPAVREEVDALIEREPMLRGWVSFDPFPAFPVETEPVEETITVGGGEYTREQAAQLVLLLSTWLDEA